MWEVSPLFAEEKAAVGVGSSFAFRGEERRGSCGRTAVVKFLRVSRGRKPRWFWEVDSSLFAKEKAAVVVGSPVVFRGEERRAGCGRCLLRVSRRGIFYRPLLSGVLPDFSKKSYHGFLRDVSIFRRESSTVLPRISRVQSRFRRGSRAIASWALSRFEIISSREVIKDFPRSR